MNVWIVQKAYRMDYEIEGVYATKELAEAACERYNVSLGNSRENHSWAATFAEYPLRE